MSNDQHRAALQAYDEALAALYQREGQAVVAAVGEEVAQPAVDETLMDQVVLASWAAEKSAVALLHSEDPNLREAGELQLAALAARDFAVAHDLARLDSDEGAEVASIEPTQTALAEIEPELSFVWAADPRDGVPILHDEWEGMTTFASVDEDPCSTLKHGLEGAVDQVRDAAGEIVRDGLGRLVGLSLGEALGAAGGELLQHLPRRVSILWRRAVELFRNGVAKLRQLFGTLFDTALVKVRGWLGDHATVEVLDIVYGSDALKGELASLARKTPSGAKCAELATAVEQIVGKFQTQKKVLLLLFKGLAFCKRWILKLIAPPWGTVAVSGAFGLGIGYAIASGGDYIDWRRTKDDGFFDFVRGIRTTAEAALSEAALP